MAASPPPYYRTIYDETHRSISFPDPCIDSMANRPNLIGKLEHHSPTTDGSFSICIASGEGVFISQALYESIPAEHRPSLNTADAGRSVPTLATAPMTSIGSTFMPIILTNKDTREKFRIVLYAFVLPNLFMGMFISDRPFVRTQQWSSAGCTFGLGFDEADWDNQIKVQGI